jgi:hypothetical protein
MKKFIFYFFLFSIIVSVYTLLFPVNSYQKLSYFLNSTFFTDTIEQNGNKIDGYYYYDTEVGYFSVDSGMTKTFKTAEDQSIQANIFGYVTYNKVGDTISFYINNGSKVKDVKNFGYPYIPADLPFVYILKTNGQGFTQYSISGDELLKNINFSALISSISVDKNGNTLVSNLDGKTFLYSPKGEVLFSTDSEGNDSKIIITKSNAIDMDGNYMGICSGLNPEYIELFQKKTGTRIAVLKSDTNFRYRSFMQFNKNRLYFEGKETLKYLDVQKKKEGKIDFVGELKEVQFDNSGNVICITSKGVLNYLTVYYPNGYKQFYKEFKSELSNLKVYDKNAFYFKNDNKIIKVKLKKTA